jgi:hypothetical protein
MAILGDTIDYLAAGGAFATTRGYVEFSEIEHDLQTGAIIAQRITVEVRHVDVPVRPGVQSRVRLKKTGAQQYRPINVRNAEDGAHWLFELEKVSA